MRRCAFTLVEVLISLGVLAMLTSALGAFMIDLRNQTALLRDLSMDRRGAETLFQFLDEHLAAPIGITAEHEPGIVGESDSLVVFFRQIFPGEEGMGVVRGVRVEFDEEAGELWIADPGESGTRELLSDRVELMRIRYHDGEGWVERFAPSAERSLPAAVEVGLWFLPVGYEAPVGDELMGAGASGGMSDDGVVDVDRFSPEQVEDRFAEMEGEERVVRAPDRLRVYAVLGGEVVR